MCTHFSAHDNRFLYKEGVIIASVNKCSGNRFNIFKFYMNFKVEIHCRYLDSNVDGENKYKKWHGSILFTSRCPVDVDIYCIYLHSNHLPIYQYFINTYALSTCTYRY